MWLVCKKSVHDQQVKCDNNSHGCRHNLCSILGVALFFPVLFYVDWQLTNDVRRQYANMRWDLAKILQWAALIRSAVVSQTFITKKYLNYRNLSRRAYVWQIIHNFEGFNTISKIHRQLAIWKQLFFQFKQPRITPLCYSKS